MKTFEQWLKANGYPEMPKGTVNAEWFIEHGLPMIVECSCCTMTMALPNALIDDEGNIYCHDCGGAEYEEAKPDMTLEEALEKLKGTTAFIYETISGKYHWFAIMSESSFPFDTVREAYEEAADYLSKGGY